MSRQYYGIENVGMTSGQKATLINVLKQLGDNQNPNSCKRNHWRVRLDGDAVIFEAQYDDSDWTLDSMKQKLADIFGVSVSNIDASSQSTSYGPLVTFAYNSSDKIRMIAFAGLLATYEDSHNAVLAYLIANKVDWEREL